uniref:DEAD-box helicase OB fold domain-containing protein n=1 Tax=Strigamia maritima TaxID=126957 RepID=T1IVK7_STRMM
MLPRLIFMDAPPEESLVMAMKQLHSLSALDDKGLLTSLGINMTKYDKIPHGPISCKNVNYVYLRCSEEILTIVSIQLALANEKKAKFNQLEGDHLTLLPVYNSWKANNFDHYDHWCNENYLQSKTLKRVRDVRKQLMDIMDKHRLGIVSCGKNIDQVQKAIWSGTLVNDQVVDIHSSSALYDRKPEWVVYHELTTKKYMHEVTAIDPKWLVTFAPAFFKFADPTKLSKSKKRQTLKPLHNK